VKTRPEGRPEFDSRLIEIEQAEPLRLEIESFLAAVGGAPISVPGGEGRRALSLAVEVTDRIREHAERAGVPSGR
jgi:hypothetical protein